MMHSITLFLSLTSFLMFSFFKPKTKKSNITTQMMGGMSLTSITGLTLWFLTDCPTFFISLSWFKTKLNEFSLSFFMDPAFMMFSSMALFVTWSIMEFSLYYMKKDPKKQSFLKTLMLFLLLMLMLVSSNKLFLLFIGWEGVGMLSFILMSWWFTRTDAKSAAMQAIMYNRMGDSGMLLFLVSSMTLLNSWNLAELYMLKSHTPLPTLAMVGIMMAAAGKSAQFSLHPWLPSAMEGPTPVSALLHSSTMVVAGVFLLYRSTPLMNSSTLTLSMMSMLGSLTALFAASAALGQYDIKKVVAYSTTSQLGLMVVAMGMKIPQLALFHMCTHAFFKSLLFLCSGSMMHSLNKEQDLRKMSNSSIMLPTTTSCTMMGSMALCGFPFLAGYYSKDLMLEATQTNMTKSISILFSLIATLMTAIYSFRMIFYLSSYKTNTNPMKPIKEEDPNLMKPLLRLILGVFFTGWLMSMMTMDFEPFIMKLTSKSLPIIFTMYAGMFMFEQLKPKPLSKKTLHNSTKFMSKKWFFVKITHGKANLTMLTQSLLGVLRSLDQGWTTQIGASGMSQSMTNLTKTAQKSQSGNLLHYMLYSTIMTMALLALTL